MGAAYFERAKGKGKDPDARRTIGFDVDDTLVRTTPMAFAYAERQFGAVASKEFMKEDRLSKAFPTLSQTQIAEAFRAPWQDPSRLKPIDRDIQGIFERIRRDSKLDVMILTASFSDTDRIRWWLRRNGITYEYFMHVSRASDKAEAPVSVLVDDSVMTGVAFGERKRPYLWMEWRINEEARARLLSYPTVFAARSLQEVPAVLKENAALRQLIRRGAQDAVLPDL